MPSLAGPSRKRFVRDLNGAEWKGDNYHAMFGTAAAVTACVQKGCDFVRVHDVKEMKAVCAVADKLYRE